MSKIGVMMSANQPDGPMSSHFGKAPWIMVAGLANADLEFVRNEGMNGASAAEIVVRMGCTDVIVTDIGDGALVRLQAAQIRAWAVPAPVSGTEALRLLMTRQLPRVPPAQVGAGRSGDHGCCCAGGGRSETSGCCRD